MQTHIREKKEYLILVLSYSMPKLLDKYWLQLGLELSYLMKINKQHVGKQIGA